MSAGSHRSPAFAQAAVRAPSPLPAVLRRLAFGAAQAAAIGLIRAVAAATIRLVPPQRAYDVAHRLVVLTCPLLSLPYRALAPPRRRRDWRPLMLQNALAVMTRIAPGFPIRVRLEDGGALDAAYRESGRVILCTAHFGLTLAAPRALLDRGYRSVMIAGGPGCTGDGWNWGLREPLTLVNDGPEALLHARAALGQGRVVVCYADYVLDRAADGSHRMAISPNVFRFASRAGAAVLFMASRLDRDGTIAIEIERPPPCGAHGAEPLHGGVARFAEFVRRRTGMSYAIRPPRKAGPGGA